jgi:catechol 2,3-dioxygenase-like lactoylglutathione lyase family enzyme
MVDLAKPAIDVGLFTNQRETMLAFWQQRAGAVFREDLPIGGGVMQHRHGYGDSVLKINHCREALPQAPPSGIRRLVIARPGLAEPVTLRDPDGNAVRLVPPGEVPQLRVELTVSQLPAHQEFYGGALGLPALDDVTFGCGASQIHLQSGAANLNPIQQAVGYRYLTIQVFDVRACHAEILRKGGREGRPPVRLGDVAHISFVRDPDGNWIEVSQRKSITGSLDSALD